jgi:hypothetical protein
MIRYDRCERVFPFIDRTYAALGAAPADKTNLAAGKAGICAIGVLLQNADVVLGFSSL